MAELSRRARAEVVAAARAYSATYRDIPAQPNLDRVFLAGHQPELFHPGVWAKNFALSRLATGTRGVAVNLLVDSDTLKRSTIRVPTGDLARPRVEEVPFDAPGPEIPYEQRTIVDRESWCTFGDRVQHHLASLVRDPLIAEYWPRVLARSQHESLIGACFAQARHELEGDWGLTTLELPQSRVCALDSFAWFAAHLFAEAERFRSVHNHALQRYRRQYHIRSANHPVPELSKDENGIEMPFWIWTRENPRRRRLYVRRRGAAWELADRAGWRHELSAGPVDARTFVERILALPVRGVKLRSRALATTMFARVFVGDLFIHGIGGAKYDELTDAIVRRFYGIEPPGYLVLSATLRLPIARPPVGADDLRAVDRRLRELKFHPEQFISESRAHEPITCSSNSNDTTIGELIREKKHWIAESQTRENARLRCRAIRNVNGCLHSALGEEQRRTAAQRHQVVQALGAEQVLAGREYAFCLYPSSQLQDFLLEICPSSR
ncbi:MAG: hypothetical protein K2Y37_05685 [Pirellulales bacterium]|nr:hypothetical protein [Pirellulales bacterium]